MRKKIIIVTKQLVMGGVEKALLSMIESIPKNKYEITLVIMQSGGELAEKVPKHISIKPLFGHENYFLDKLSQSWKSRKFYRAFKILWYTLLARMTKNVFKQEKYYAKRDPILERYDMAIAYHVPASLPVVHVIENINAETKIAWIHMDVSTYPYHQLQPYSKYYKKYDKIFCVSEYAMKKFNETIPGLANKTSVFYNIFDRNQMNKLVKEEEGFKDQFEGIRILTIGRLSSEKGQEILPVILKRLRIEGFNVRWYCIGDGKIRGKLERLVNQYGIEENFILLGTVMNPYNYIKQCDIYVQPSIHEGFCISLAEARAFNKPIVTTNFTGAKEQIKNGETGLIVNYDTDEIYKAVKNLIINKDLCRRFEENLKQARVSTTNEINKLFSTVGSSS